MLLHAVIHPAFGIRVVFRQARGRKKTARMAANGLLRAITRCGGVEWAVIVRHIAGTAWPRVQGRAILCAMQLARVVGRVVSTVKQETLAGVALQWLQPVDTRGVSNGKPIVAVDRIGVGPGEVIYYITSREAAMTLDNSFAAVDAGIVGKVDHVDVGGERLLGDTPASGGR